MTYDNDKQRQEKREYAKRDAKDDEIDEMIDSWFYLFYQASLAQYLQHLHHEEIFVPENDSPQLVGDKNDNILTISVLASTIFTIQLIGIILAVAFKCMVRPVGMGYERLQHSSEI